MREAYRVEEVAGAMRSEILQGNFSPRLPSALSLRQRFLCNSRTLAKALVLLQSEGLLRRHGRSYAIGYATTDAGHPRDRPGRRGSALFLVGVAKAVDSQPHFGLPFVRGIEAAMHGLSWGALQCFVSERPQPGDGPPARVLGGIIHAGFGRHDAWKAWLEARRQTPMVLVDMAEQIRWAPSKVGWFRILRPDNSLAGKELAQHFLALGHRHVALFSPLGPEVSSYWPQLRLDGLRTEFEAAGGSIEVFYPVGQPENAHARALEGLRRSLRAAGRLSENALRLGMRHSYNLLDSDALAWRLREAFAAALKRPRVTGWIGLNDSVAAAAQHFLEERAPGAALSLAGFDNTPLSYLLDITSYDFRFDALGQMAVHALAFPKSCRADREHVVRLPGRLVPRGSVRMVSGMGESSKPR